MFFQDVGNYVDLWPYKPFLIEIRNESLEDFFLSMFGQTRANHLHCGPKRTHHDICGCMNKNVTEICVNIIPEPATSTSAAEKYTERHPIGQIHSDQRTSRCHCGASQGGKLELSFQLFESGVEVDLTGQLEI